MREDDLEAVLAIERSAYAFPWTPGIFRDCLGASYPCWLMQIDGIAAGYAVLSVAAGEAHILNLCVAPSHQGRGLSRVLLDRVIETARGRGADRIFLEVRPSNPVAIALYRSAGFNEIGTRPGYYPAPNGREDAIVMALELTLP